MSEVAQNDNTGNTSVVPCGVLRAAQVRFIERSPASGSDLARFRPEVLAKAA